MHSWHGCRKTAAITADMLMTLHLLGLLKSDVGLAGQPLITKGLVLGVENVRGGSSGWDSLIFYHKQIRVCVCSSAVSVRWRWINNPVVSFASDKPDQTDAVLNLALFPLLLFFLGMSPGGLDYSLIALKLKTKQFQKAFWLVVCNFRLQPSLALGPTSRSSALIGPAG